MEIARVNANTASHAAPTALLHCVAGAPGADRVSGMAFPPPTRPIRVYQ
ncbi:hypothetical protein I546_3079 [Mycobacterium kansasii 732]|nr:hypothetical protein I546_3079 [Mycobacterium kansasii 732]